MKASAFDPQPSPTLSVQEGYTTWAAIYDEMLTGLPVQVPVVADGNEHAYYLYTVKADRRDELKQYLLDHSIGCYVVYPYLVPETGAYQSLGVDRAGFPQAAHDVDQILSLPMFPELLDEEAVQVCNTIRAFYSG